MTPRQWADALTVEDLCRLITPRRALATGRVVPVDAVYQHGPCGADGLNLTPAAILDYLRELAAEAEVRDAGSWVWHWPTCPERNAALGILRGHGLVEARRWVGLVVTPRSVPESPK